MPLTINNFGEYKSSETVWLITCEAGDKVADIAEAIKKHVEADIPFSMRQLRRYNIPTPTYVIRVSSPIG